MRVGFFGDVHGIFDIFYQMLQQSVHRYSISVAFQVGDFGFSKRMVLPQVQTGHSVPLYLIEGNHEDFSFLHRADKHGNIEEWKENRFYYQRRGSVRKIGGYSVGFIGGALNVDRPQLRKNGNVITNDQVMAAADAFNAERLDFIVSHSCPAGIGIGMRGEPALAHCVARNIVMDGYDPGPSDDLGEVQLSDLWSRIQRKPYMWVYGHFHRFRMCHVDGTNFVCLPQIDVLRQCVIWDSETGEIALNTMEINT